jgi:glycosyltransferase involved in cell wall biosynthesis
VLPHGAVANFHGPTKDLAVADGPVLLTWGLLGPGKGIERAIQALADLPPDVPQPTYVVAGRTHPQVVAREGERYREGLSKLAADLGVGHLVVFDDDYRDWVELRTLVRSADVVVLPYDSHDQVTSGVLVEAVASGKPVVATAFPHACEVLQSGAGIVVAHDDGAALTAAFHVLTTDPGQRRRMADAARREAVELLWPRVGERYLELSAWSTRALDDVA